MSKYELSLIRIFPYVMELYPYLPVFGQNLSDSVQIPLSGRNWRTCVQIGELIQCVDSRGCFWCTYKSPHIHCDKLPLQKTCLNSQILPHLHCDKLPLQKYLPKQSIYLMREGRWVIENGILVYFHSFLVIKSSP